MTTDSLVKVEERDKKAIFNNQQREIFYKIDVDGCIVRNETSADKIVKKPSNKNNGSCKALVVELKGSPDVAHAVDQIDATISLLRNTDATCKNIAALIVCNSSPAYSSNARKGQELIRKKHRVALYVTTKNKIHDFESFFT